MIPIMSNSETLSGCYFQKDLFYSLYGEVIGDRSRWANEKEENGIHRAECIMREQLFIGNFKRNRNTIFTWENIIRKRA